MRTRVALWLLIWLAVLPSSWSHGARGTVTIALSGEPTTMDPHVVSDFIGTTVWPWVMERLVVSETGTGKIAPWLAEKWERLSSTQIKFYLRKGVKFSDGAPLDAKAVEYSIGRIFDPANKSAQRTFFQLFDRIEVIDDHSFIWHSKKADNGLMNRLVNIGHIISPRTRGTDKTAMSLNPVGSGPYLLKNWVKGQRMTFEANPGWWGNQTYPGRPQTIILRRIQESSVRVKAFLAGEIDIITGVLPHFIPDLRRNPMVDVKAIPAIRVMFLSFISRHGGPFADERVRMAANYAIDAELIRKTILGGNAELYGQIINPWVYSGYNPEKAWHGYDLAKAKQLMKEAGHESGFKADLITAVGRYPGDKETCEAVAGMLKSIRIETTCSAQAFNLFRQNLTAYQSGAKKGAAMYYMGFGSSSGDPALMMRATTGCKSPWSGACLKEIDEMIERAAGLEDPKAQQAAFEGVTDLMKAKAAHKILFRTHDIYGVSKRVRFQPRHDETLHPWEITVLR